MCTYKVIFLHTYIHIHVKIILPKDHNLHFMYITLKILSSKKNNSHLKMFQLFITWPERGENLIILAEIIWDYFEIPKGFCVLHMIYLRVKICSILTNYKNVMLYIFLLTRQSTFQPTENIYSANMATYQTLLLYHNKGILLVYYEFY